MWFKYGLKAQKLLDQGVWGHARKDCKRSSGFSAFLAFWRFKNMIYWVKSERLHGAPPGLSLIHI